jgi:hypothetical protein|tara:strand:- start:39 stop:269 length:231 start_codon:yes stop_codon:yes gene_type:complete
MVGIGGIPVINVYRRIKTGIETTPARKTTMRMVSSMREASYLEAPVLSTFSPGNFGVAGIWGDGHNSRDFPISGGE